MPHSDYPSIQHEWFNEVWNLGDESAIDRLCTDDVVGHGLAGPDGQPVKSRDAFREFFRSFRASFPDIQIEVEEAVSAGENCVCRCRVKATHTGEGFLGPASGASVDFTGMCWVKVRDGRIAESWNSFDFLSVVQQIEAART